MSLARYKKYYKDGYYHIYNRGVGKQKIFKDKKDYIKYLKILKLAKEKHFVSVLCYCLMPNHIHLVLRQETEVPIYKFMQSLHTSYGIYFNKKYDRVGGLWQDRFKQKNIFDNSYLLYLSVYIHLNPLIDKITENLNEYIWSSYLDYAGLRNGSLCDKEMVLQGQSLFEYKKLVEENTEIINERKGIRYLTKDCP